MDASKTRRENFIVLLSAFRAEHADKPDRGMLKLFSEKLDISDRYLSHVKCGRKEIGHANARKIEEACKLPAGWLDQTHGELEPRDLHERAFIETAMALYRSNAAEAQAMMTDALKKRLSGK